MLLLWVCQSHGLRNELHFRLKELLRLVQCSRFLPARDLKCLCLLEAGRSGKMISSQMNDELKLVAQPVGQSSKCGYQEVAVGKFTEGWTDFALKDGNLI